MDKAKAKEKLKYVEKLDVDARYRYLSKLRLLNSFDPYESAEKEWTQDLNLLPPVMFGDMVNYLVFTRSAYTWEEFKCYKSLEAHNQFTNGWVQDLKIHKPDNCENTVVKSKVLHSMRLSEKPLQPWVILDNTGSVETAHCDCMAGLAETCTHVGALLFKIEAVVRIREKPTVTGVPAYWMIPGGIYRIDPEVGYRIDYTSAPAKKKRLDQAIASGVLGPQSLRTGASCNTKAPRTTPAEFDTYLKAMHDTGDKPAILAIMPGYCEHFKDHVQPVIVPKSLWTLRNEKLDKVSKVDLFKHCEGLLHDKRVLVGSDEAAKIETETKDQHKAPSWYAIRAGRITASRLHSVISCNLDKPAPSTVQDVCYPGQRKISAPAVQWGTRNEQAAYEMYKSDQKKTHIDFAMQKSGFLINPDFPYMGASPDGVMWCECCGKGCLEIKCPYKHKQSTVSEACKDRDFCLEQKNGQFLLKKNHKYYSQVQCQLLVSGSDYCDFVVWTELDLVTVHVAPDHDFFEMCKQKAKDFFERVVLPELVARYYTRTATSTAKRPLALSVSPGRNVPVPKRGRKSAKELWCHCRRPEEYDDMVACDNQNCNVQWYHVGCVGLDKLPESNDPWFCDTCQTSQHD